MKKNGDITEGGIIFRPEGKKRMGLCFAGGWVFRILGA